MFKIFHKVYLRTFSHIQRTQSLIGLFDLAIVEPEKIKRKRQGCGYLVYQQLKQTPHINHVGFTIP